MHHCPQCQAKVFKPFGFCSYACEISFETGIPKDRVVKMLNNNRCYWPKSHKRISWGGFQARTFTLDTIENNNINQCHFSA